MASGLQCPGCGHVHPAGLPEIARGDDTFRCYGCYRTLSVPDGWTGRPSHRLSAPSPGPVGDGPPGVGTRDARAARLAARRATRRGSPGGDEPTQMVSTAGPDLEGASPAANHPDAGGAGVPGSSWPAAGAAGAPPASNWRAAGSTAAPAGTRGTNAGSVAGPPLGWVAPRRTGRSVPAPVRAGVWAVAFGVGLLVTAFVLRAAGLLGVNTAIDIYAGSGAHRFGILLVLLPVWALLSATIAHFSLEGLARRRPRTAKRS